MKMTLDRAYWRFATSALIALAFTGITAFAQAPASRLTGTISDASGTAVGRSTIILSTTEGRTEAITTGSAAGTYVFSGLQTGSYILQVFAVGFGPSRMANAQVEEGTELKQDLTMDIGYAQDSVPVTASPSETVRCTSPK